jgi:hypothetical protein
MFGAEIQILREALGKAVQEDHLHFLVGEIRNPSSPQDVARAIVPWNSNPANTFLGVISCAGCITLWARSSPMEKPTFMLTRISVICLLPKASNPVLCHFQ